MFIYGRLITLADRSSSDYSSNITYQTPKDTTMVSFLNETFKLTVLHLVLQFYFSIKIVQVIKKKNTKIPR